MSEKPGGGGGMLSFQAVNMLVTDTRKVRPLQVSLLLVSGK